MYKVAVITGTRAEYGLLRPVLRKLFDHPGITPLLFVTGAHLSPAYGETITEIQADGFLIHAKLDILAKPVPEGRTGTAYRTAFALELFLDAFKAADPDIVLLLGDRYEIFAAAEAAALLDIPLAHISGGEVTVGADDDWFRHCVSKMAKLHFPSCALHAQRLLRMGEQPGRVWDVGGLGDENIRNTSLLSQAELSESLGLELKKPLAKPLALVTFHPETASRKAPEEQAAILLQAIDDNPGLFYLFTAANADAGGDVMNAAYQAYCDTHSNTVWFSSLGSLRYLSVMALASLVLGNSSSGVVETLSFGIPTVNIGDRQLGRMLCDNIISCKLDACAISEAIRQSQTPDFIRRARQVISPYNAGDTSGKIVSILYDALENRSLQGPKIFYDGAKGTP